MDQEVTQEGTHEPPEEEKRKQTTTHINITSDEVYKSTGETHKKWLSSAETEVGNLTGIRRKMSTGEHRQLI